MEPIIRSENSLELTRNGKHCTIVGNIAGVTDEYILKLTEWANTLWDYDRISMWKKSDSMEPGYFIRDSAGGKYKVHVLDREQLEALFGASRRDSPPRLQGWEKKNLMAYVDWFVQ
ncbi:MAG: hypothetical protein PWR29_900 [Methanolobus sp.]|nr:hypothetical protein [Methanolobus sp.]MDK2833937.1 hypothetical protein [Methanolobus sp.]MDK2911943.1 hypothetical protein [Methanolobus sp.]